MTRRPELPVDLILPKLLATITRHNSLVLEAQPGAGKTTRVPPALLAVLTGEIIVLEPRRIAARLAARRVAFELGEDVGQTVGYQVRFEEKISPRTRLRFVTEGILTRRLLTDPQLRNVDAVILDEFHERHLDSDLAVALLKRLQRSRPELKLVVMSATLDAAPIARYLKDCPILRSEGRAFPLTVRHLPYSALPLQSQVRNAVDILNSEGHTGNILAFLPGAAEIRRAMQECAPLTQRTGLLVLPLHGDLPPAEQDRAVLPTKERKLILATNVAESSVTVEGVSAVIDSGLARIASYSPWTGLPTLTIGRISKASATQRAGRAGRTGAGKVLRLYPQEDFALRPDHDLPEIKRTDLSQLLLSLRAMRIEHISDLTWLDIPPEDAVRIAENLLDRLGATNETAQQLARFPLPPRLSRVLVESLVRNVGEDGCRAAALLALGARVEKSDLLAALDLPPDPRLRQQTDQLLCLAHPPRQMCKDDDALLLSILAGFPDRVARRRKDNQVLLATGISAEIFGEPPPYEFMVALDAEDRKENPLPLIRMTSRIEPEWLIDLFPESVRELTDVIWNEAAERVEQLNQLVYDKLVLEESRGPVAEAPAAALLAQKAFERGIEHFVDKESLDAYLARLAFAGFEQPDLAATLRDLSLGLRSFNDLRAAGKNFLALLKNSIDTRRLNELAPLHIRLKNGRQTNIHYDHGKPPWIASRLQDFFGMNNVPAIGRDKQPLVIHLLAPNHRAVQTTTDLAGFWQRLYPQVRRELMRRYPRHQWPENPLV